MENKVSSSTPSRSSKRSQKVGNRGIVIKEENPDPEMEGAAGMLEAFGFTIKTEEDLEEDFQEEWESPTSSFLLQAPEVPMLPENLDDAHAEILRLRKILMLKEIQLNAVAEKVYHLELQLAAKTEVDETDVESTNSIGINVGALQDEMPNVFRSGVNRGVNVDGASEKNKWLGSADEVLSIVLKTQSNQFGIHWAEFSDVLRKCRLVCKTWKNSVDQFLEEDSSHMKLCSTNLELIQFRQHYSPVTTRLSSEFPKDEAERIQYFIDFYLRHQEIDSTYVPLPNQHLFIECYRLSKNADDFKVVNNWTIFSGAVEQFLVMFGRTVRSLTLAIDMQGYLRARKPSHLLPMYRSFCEWLRLLPQLKSLALITCNDQSKYTNIDGKRQNLNELLKFPVLKNLEVFQSTQLSSFAQFLLKKNNHIQKLFLGDSEWPLMNSTAVENLNLPNLLECTLHIDRSKQQFITGANGLLRTETLTICFHDRNVSGTILQVPFTSTVVFLNLEQKNVCDNDSFNDQLLEAPHLKHITITSQKWEEIDWQKLLERACLLETITVEMSTQRKQETANCWVNEQGFWGYLRSIQHGTYWYFLPHLKSIQFVLKFYGTSNEPFQSFTHNHKLERYAMSPIECKVLVKGAEADYFLNFK